MVPAIEGRDVREGGGGMGVRGPFVGWSIGFLVVPDGVFVLVELPDEAVEPSCLVGDLLGDYRSSATFPHKTGTNRQIRGPTASLDTPAGLAAGVGLPALILLLFPAVGSSMLCLFSAPTLLILDGLDFVAAPFAFPFVIFAGLGVASSSTMWTAPGLMNMPYPGGQSKYRFP